MKFLHTSDWHIGKRIYGVSLLEDQRYLLNQLIDSIALEKPNFMIIAGDLYDRSVPPVEAVNLVDNTLSRIAAMAVTIYVIPGNHDSPGRLGFLSEQLMASHIFIASNYQQALKPFIYKTSAYEVALYLVPFLEPFIVSQITGDATIKTHNDVFKHLSRIWQKDDANVDYRIVVAHGFFGANSETSESERPLSIGGTEIVDANCFRGFDYAALGHLHRAQKVMQPTIRYAGALMKYSFSECNDTKSVSWVTLQNNDVEIEKQTLQPLRDMRYVEGAFTEMMATSQKNDDYTMIHLTDNQVLYEPLKRLRTVYPNLLKLSIQATQDNMALPTTSMELKEKNLASLFAEFYHEVMGMPISDALMTVFLDHFKQEVGDRCET